MKGIDLHDIQQMLGYDVAKPYIEQARSARVLYNVVRELCGDSKKKEGFISLKEWDVAF